MATKLDLADAQFIGFYHGKWNRDDIIPLVKSMGLTKNEWKKMRKNYTTDIYLTDVEISEIDKFFNL